jgi:hypothetical protein
MILIISLVAFFYVHASAAGDSKTATALSAEVSCDRGDHSKGIASLSWTVASVAGSQQKVEVTIFRDGFQRNEFESSEILPPGQTSLVWDRLRGQAIHFARVLTKHKEEWVPSKLTSFEGPTCVMDLSRELENKVPVNK